MLRRLPLLLHCLSLPQLSSLAVVAPGEKTDVDLLLVMLLQIMLSPQSTSASQRPFTSTPARHVFQHERDAAQQNVQTISITPFESTPLLDRYSMTCSVPDMG